mmetsp:Transcript_56547/g.104673  ORF Transcript_56547/g.104673 Transcript_56547/m.104673 type:complete len:223 (+) Transcript_56547:51-719(+)
MHSMLAYGRAVSGFQLLVICCFIRTCAALEVARGHRAKMLNSTSTTPSNKVPLISQQECDLLQQGILLRPEVDCVYSVFAVNWDGCTCSIQLPANIRPSPDAFQNVAVESSTAPPEGDWDDAAAFSQGTTITTGQTTPAPEVITVYRPPISEPMCPYQTPCPTVNSSADCVDYRSWGFADMSMAGYKPASAHLNSISCSYIMQPKFIFKVPDKVQALWRQSR